MKTLLVILAVFLTACATPPPVTDRPVADRPVADRIVVTGSGRTFKDAKDNAFKNAIESRAGIILLSERETDQGRLIKNEILTYASGYVDEYKILNQTIVGGTITLTLEVQVSMSKIANRVLTTNKTADVIDGDRLITQRNTFIENKYRGDALLTKVLKDYPSKAYNLIQLPTQFKLDNNRRMVMYMPFELSWNHNYIVALNEALGLLEDTDIGFMERAAGTVTTMVKSPDAVLIGEKKSFKFDDLHRIRQIHDAMRGENEFRLHWTLKDYRGQIAQQGCIESGVQRGITKDKYKRTNPFYSTDTKQTIVYGNSTEKDVIEFDFYTVPWLRKVIEKDFKVEVTVVPVTGCREGDGMYTPFFYD
jgi:hypothetical protein